MKKILIIEDEIAIAELERDYLELENFEVKIATDAKTGLELALNENFNLIVLDIMLPGGNGFNICKEIRKSKNTPIIMVSAKGEDIDKIRGLGLGANDYVTKPFSPQELVARIKTNIIRYDSVLNMKTPSNNILIENLKIEIKSRRVYLNNKEIILTNKEFDVLLYLAQNRQVVLNKEQIFDHVWNYDTYGDISTVAVHIRKIREKLEKNNTFIDTIWGAGYRFI